MTRKTWRTWTVKEIRRLESLRLDGLTAPQIAAELGRTVASVKCRLAQEGITKPRSERWIEVFSGPHRMKDVAAKMGVKYGTVKHAKRRLRRAGVDGILDAERSDGR